MACIGERKGKEERGGILHSAFSGRGKKKASVVFGEKRCAQNAKKNCNVLKRELRKGGGEEKVLRKEYRSSSPSKIGGGGEKKTDELGVIVET